MLVRSTRQVVVFGEVEEAGELALKRHRHSASGTMPLLRNNDFRFAASVSRLGFPSEVLVGARLGRLVFEIIFFTKHKQYDVGVLFNRARFAKV